MSLENNQRIDPSLSEEDTRVHQRIPETQLPGIPVMPQTPGKTLLERLPFSEVTSPLMQVIRGIRIECLSEYFEQTCDRQQYATAVICGSSQLTYQELDHRANRLTHFLISHGVEKGDAIGILLERSLYTYVALLGVLKAGAVFVPLDPSFPSDVITFITKDAALQGLVTTSTFREKTSALPCPVLELDQAYGLLSVQPESRPEVRVDPASLCYIIYTLDGNSRPKGFAVSHANIVNILRIVIKIYRVTRNDRVYQGMALTFDFSQGEIWSTWIAGATLIVDSPDTQHHGHSLTEFLIEHRITMLFCIPALLDMIESNIPSLRILLIVGEPCPAYLVSRWLRNGRRMLKTYGPIETVVNAAWCELLLGRSLTIGSPFPMYRIYILDNQFRLVQDGESGEICIGGPGIATSHLNHSHQTNDRFVPNPVWRDRGIVPYLYRTGDIGRSTPSGEIEYLGRIDAEMKTHNYHSESDNILREAFSQVNTTPLVAPPWTGKISLNEYAATLPLVSKAVSEQKAETFKLTVPDQKNIKSLIHHIISDQLYRNSILNIASSFILGGLGFVFWIIIARLYRTEMVGIATTLISIMGLLSTFTVVGLNVSLFKYLPKIANKSELINSAFVIVTIVTILACAVFLLGLRFFSPQLLFLQSNPFFIISFTTFIIFCSWNLLVGDIFMALRSAHNILIKNIIISSLKLVLPFALVTFGAYGIFASSALSLIVAVIISFIIFYFKFNIKLSISVNVSLIKDISSYSFANYIVDFMINMPSLIFPVIILNILSAKYVAYYYVASMIQSILMVIPLASAQALLTEGSYNESELIKHIKKAIITILVILVPATLIVVLGAKLLLQFFGNDYTEGALTFLQLYSISTVFTAFLLIFNAVLNIKHKLNTLVVFNITTAILTLCLSYAFISDKLVGVGWGWIVGQGIAGLISIYFIVHNCLVTSQSQASPNKI